MAGLVDYDSSSSSSDAEPDLWANKRRRTSQTSIPDHLNASFSVAEGESKDCLHTNRASQLEEMGCSSELISLAISLCDEGAAISDLFDFIQAYKCSLEEERIEPEPPVAEESPLLQKLRDDSPLSATFSREIDSERKNEFTQMAGSNREASCSRIPSVGDQNMPTLLSLQEMGFSKAEIQKASDQCCSIDCEVLLDYLLVECKANTFTNEDLEYKAVPQHTDEGHIYDALKKALSSSESNDIEGILHPDLFGSFKNKGESGVLEGHTEGYLVTNAESSYSSLLSSEVERSFRYDFDTREGGSRIEIASKGVVRQESGAAIRWTKAMENLWTGYMGGSKKLECSPLPDSDDSAEIFQPDWEDRSQIARDCKRKSRFTDCKKIEKERPQSGKMMGFGIPGFLVGRPKQLPQSMIGRPYFYFENVAGVPNKEWETIKRHFNGVDPEFTDSKFFSASRRARGYVHNLPVEGRTAVHYEPLMTIFEAFPHMRKYWPQWDTRDKLNCINTRKAADKMCGLIRTLFAMFEGKELPYQRQQEIVQVCKRWNLVWVGPGKAAPLEPHEIEVLLGFDQDHTRGCASATERYDGLGNSFQVDTVAYHLSPLKLLYPHGIVVLSLFSGIGGAEVALHKLGIYLKVVIAVEINEKVRGILAAWWRRSGQKGELRLKNDVRDLTYDVLAELVDDVGPIDLIIGGSPCNNLSGNNRVSRSGLSGSESSLFFEFPRILNIVKQIMHDRGFM